MYSQFVRRSLLASALVLAALPASANCYYVYSEKNQLLYRSQTPPVNLSQPLHEAVAALGVPGARLIFTASTALCEGTFDIVRTYRTSPAARQARKAPAKAGVKAPGREQGA